MTEIEKILNPKVRYAEIFPNNLDAAKTTYRQLCKKYHPDVCADERAY
jgi:hypothetical protein